MESSHAPPEIRRPAFAIMAKRPEVGRTKTRLSPPLTERDAAVLYGAMLRDTITLVAGIDGTRLAIAVTPPDAVDKFRRISPPGTLMIPVAGRDIGDCLSQVLESLLARGHPAAFAVNSDGPTLPVAYLQGAIALIQDADVVLGPSEDGGYYLIGLKETQPALFRGVEWSTERVTVQTLERAESLGLLVAQLPPWYDVDAAADFDRLQAEIARLPPHVLVHTRRFISRWRTAARGGRGGP